MLLRYCACFAAQIYCCPTCNCVGCANTVNSINERQDAVKQILDRNPSAFESKFKSITHPWKVGNLEASLIYLGSCCRP